MTDQTKHIHEAILGDVTLSQRLRRINKGYNLVNLDPTKRPFRIEILLEVTLDLEDGEETLQVCHNLPFGRYGGETEDDFEDFLQELSEWVKLPLYTPRGFNRVDKVDDYRVDKTIQYRRVTIQMSDVVITVHDIAREYLKRKHGVEDFAKVVAELLARQKPATKEQVRAIDRWMFLQERMLYLDKMVEPSSRSYYYGYRSPDDETQKFRMCMEDYNKALKTVEQEMRRLAGKHEFLDIEGVRFDYLSEGEEADDDGDADDEEWDEEYDNGDD